MLHKSFKSRLCLPTSTLIRAYKPSSKFVVSEQVLIDGVPSSTYSVKELDFSKKDVTFNDFRLSNLLQVGFLDKATLCHVSMSNLSISDQIS